MPDVAPQDDATADQQDTRPRGRPRRSGERRLKRIALWAGIVGAAAGILAIPGVMDHLLPGWVDASEPTRSSTSSGPGPSTSTSTSSSPADPTSSITGTSLRRLKTLPLIADGGSRWRGDDLVIPCADNTSTDSVREAEFQLPEAGAYSRFTAQASAPKNPNPDERVSVELFVSDVHVRADQTLHGAIRVLAPGQSGELAAPLSSTATSLTLRVTCKYAGSQVQLSDAGVQP